MWRCNILFLIILGGCCHAWAQVAFIATPSSPKIGIKDRVQIQFVIKNLNDLKDVKPGGFGDFTYVEGPYGSQNFSDINGVRSVTTNVVYVLQPKHEGKLTIPGAIARDNAGHSYQSNPITIEVVPGSLAPTPQQIQQARRAQMQQMFGEDEDPFAAMDAQLKRLQQMQQAQMQQMQQMQQRAQAQRGAQPQQPGRPQAQNQNQADPPIDEAQLNKDVFVRVIVDKNKVHLGEQITASYKLYTRLPIEAGLTGLPNLNGFWVQYFDIPQPKPTQETIDGKKYQVFLIKKLALFPQQPGALEMDPVEIKGVARVVQQVRRRAADMFVDPSTGGTLMMSDPAFNNVYYNTTEFRPVQITLKNPPVKITVTQLPEKDQPADFGGAVGKFTITAKLDKNELTTDDVATLVLNISGAGNLKLIAAPKLALPNGINTYDPSVIDTITGRTTVISGSKILTYAITPQTPGDYEIPAIPFTYFNPESGTYTTLHTDPIKVHVAPGKHYNPAKTTNDNNLAIKDIHPNATANFSDYTVHSKPLPHSPAYWSLYALPVFAFFGLLVWRKKSDELADDSGLARHKKANKIALQRLATAKKLLLQNSKGPFHEEISKAIWLYLSDKLRIPLSSLSRETATAALTARKVPQSLLQEFENVIWECETALYATGGSNQMASTYDAAVKVISELEDTIKNTRA